MSSFIVGVRGCPDTVQLPLQATAQTTFHTIREAIAAKVCVSAIAVAIFAKGVEVTSYTSELGTEFSVNNFITYELRISTRNVPKSFEDVKAHAINFICCCGCKTALAVNGKYCILNCGCTLCLGCADKQEGDHGGAILCPYHQVPTPNDVRFHPKALCGNDEFCAEAPSSTRHEGPHDVLDKLLITQQCQLTTLENGQTTTCCNTNLVRCRCGLPPVCSSCMKKHLERSTAEVGRHALSTQTAVPTKELLSRCRQHESHSYDTFHCPRSALLCEYCYKRDMNRADVEGLADESHVKRTTTAVTTAVDELTTSIQRLEDAKAAALTQNGELLKNLSENNKRLDDNCEDYVTDTEEQFGTRISQLESIIAKLKDDCAKGVRTIRDTTKLLKEEFEKKVRLQQASIVSYIETVERLLHSTREQLAAVAHTARFAPEIIPATNAVVAFSKRFFAVTPTAITIEQCFAKCEPYKPLVRIIATTDGNYSTDVWYRPTMRSMVRNLRREKILSNPVARREKLPGLSLKEVQQAAAAAKAKDDADAAAKAKAEQEAAAAAAKAKADADAAAKAKAEQEAAAAAAKAKADADAAAKAKAVQEAATAAAKAKADADAAAKAKAEQEAAAAAAKAKADADAAARAKAAQVAAAPK